MADGTPQPALLAIAVLDFTHICVVMQAKLTLIRLFQRFTFELQPGQETLPLRETITLSAANGVFVKAIPR